MPRLEDYLGDGPRNEDLAPYLGKRVRVTIEIEGTFGRFYGDEIQVISARGVRYIQKRGIAAVEEI